MKNVIGAVLLAALLLGGVVLGLPARASQAADAAAWLEAREPSPWITIALASAKKTPDVSYLKDQAPKNALDAAMHVLAMAAAGEDPRTFTAKDRVEELKGAFDGEQLGNTSTLNDDLFGLLALSAVGEDPAVISAVKEFILANQNADGGFSWFAGGPSDTNMTAMAAIALLEAGVPASDLTEAVDYLRGSQNADGGFRSTLDGSFGSASDASSDAWIISAIVKLGQDPASWTKEGNSPIDHLRSLQAPEGFFQFQEGSGRDGFSATTTSYALVALVGGTYPVVGEAQPSTPSVSFRIEGAASTICAGTVSAQTPMEVVVQASLNCQYEYEIENGNFLVSLAGEANEGVEGWSYRVNWEWQPVAATDLRLSEEDEVLWYYGTGETRPLRLTLQQDSVATGSAATGFTEFFDGSSWTPVQAEVRVAGQSVFADALGAFSFVMDEAGVFELRAEKEGFVRSAVREVAVGDALQEVDLVVEVDEDTGGGSGGGEPSRPEVGFTVSTPEVAFPKLSPGREVSSSVGLTNMGTTPLSVAAAVRGDEVFRFLRLAGRFVDAFSLELAPDEASDVEVKLSVPAEFSSFGSKQGKLIFWGVPVQ